MITLPPEILKTLIQVVQNFLSKKLNVLLDVIPARQLLSRKNGMSHRIYILIW